MTTNNIHKTDKERGKDMQLDYFYGAEGEAYRFYQIPALLLEEKEYREITDTAKILYGILLSRLALSRKNNWIEPGTGRIFILYNRVEIAEMMGRSPNTITNAMNQLLNVGLVKKKKQGQGKADIIYVMNFTSAQNTLSYETEDNRVQEGQSFYEQAYSSAYIDEKAEADITGRNTGSNLEPGTTRDAYKEAVRQQIDYATLQTYPYDMSIIDNIVDIMVNVYASKKECLYISGDTISLNEVINRLRRIDSTHIGYILNCIRQNTTQIRKPDSYLLAVLYNAPTTIDFYYAAQVQHDMYGYKNNTDKDSGG